MGVLWSKPEPPPPVVLVPPLFDYPPIAARTRMLVPAYELMFGKLPLRTLFEDYFDNAGTVSSRIMLKPLEDPHVDLVANVSAAGDKASGTEVKGDALFRWQKDLYDPHTFVDIHVSTSEPMLKLRSCAYFPEYRLGAFGTIPLLMGNNRLSSEDYAVLGVRYGSENLSIGASFVPLPESAEVPYGAWLVGRKGSLCAGALYKPLIGGNKHPMPYTDPKNWNYAVSYGVASTSPLSPSFNFSLELARNTQLIASFYQHLVVQRRIKNPFEDNQVVGITNYIDLGLELATGIDKSKPAESGNNSLFQLGASWQANKNFLLKGKLGPSKSSVALAFKSWWRPSFTFSVTAENDHSKGTTSYGFGIRVEDLRKPSYERADPNYVMMSTNKEHLAPAALREFGQRPMFQADVESGNFDHLPTELRPISKII
ncbi:uncharacterized protein LOC123451531 isoform X1 [Hordeum vulgare subsp. vulgare]|uniref:Uncharacterized protein n=2 Tax=Hordeum vulgare subsp. vulgare TaxID=112509 RepID=A0A287GQ58_HORVV|nr:uncharacterized protein LOC123451531 isoform X1 [Hordeum vulgare subsp. vulgare]